MSERAKEVNRERKRRRNYRMDSDQEKALDRIDTTLSNIHNELVDISCATNPLSFRDHAAIAAMATLIPLAHKMAVEQKLDEETRIRFLVEDSFQIADAMEAERKKRENA